MPLIHECVVTTLTREGRPPIAPLGRKKVGASGSGTTCVLFPAEKRDQLCCADVPGSTPVLESEPVDVGVEAVVST